MVLFRIRRLGGDGLFLLRGEGDLIMPSVMPPLSEILVAVLLLGSGGVVLVAALGLRRLPDSS